MNEFEKAKEILDAKDNELPGIMLIQIAEKYQSNKDFQHLFLTGTFPRLNEFCARDNKQILQEEAELLEENPVLFALVKMKEWLKILSGPTTITKELLKQCRSDLSALAEQNVEIASGQNHTLLIS